MKRELISIVAATLLACGSAAADKRAQSPCAPGKRPIAALHGTGPAAKAAGSGPVRRAGRGCIPITRAQFRPGAQSSLSDKEIEQALKRQGFRGRLLDMKPNERGINELKVLWETREGGKRKLRYLIVDAKTGKFKREERR